MTSLPRGSPWRSKEEGSLLLGSVLWMAARLSGPLRAFGVDYPIFRELLRARILLDLRATESGIGVAGIVIAILTTWVAGLGTGVAALIEPEAQLWPVVPLSVLFFLLLFYLLNALVGMLVDPADVRVLAPHPVPDRTLFAVRMAQVFAYLLLLTGGFTAGNVLLAVFGQPVLPALLVFPLLALLTTVVALGSVALFFALLLRLVGPALFQRVSLWTQVASAALLMFGMQLGPRLVPEETAKRVWESASAWKLLWPPVQGARVFELAAGDWSARNFAGLACALATPAFALFVTLRLASRSYLAGLEGTLELGGKRARWPRGIATRLAPFLARSREQRAGLDFTLALSRREAHVLRAALPQFFSFQVMALSLGALRERGDPGVFLCVSAGLVALVVPTLLELCQGTPSPESRWVFQAAPVADEAELLRGGVKGLLLGWYGVGLALVALAQLVFAGPRALPEILLALELSLIVALIFARRFALGVPFTRDIRKVGGLENLGLIMAMFLVLGAMGALFWALTLHPLALAAGVVAAALVIRLQWRGLDAMPVSAGRRLLPPSGRDG